MEPKRRPRSSHAAAFCRKHPKHRQCPGVCSVCLTERLSKLSAAATSRANPATSSCSSSSSLSSLSSLSSSELSSYSSPVHHHSRRGKIWLMKSKSVARSRGGGFWSKLLGHRSEKRVDDGLVHSKTMRETTIVH